MDISESEVLKIVRDTLSPEQIKRSLVYWDTQARKSGEPIRIGPKTSAMPFDGVMIFVDLAPRFNWAHPCLYLFVNAKDRSTEVVKASFPPYRGEFPETVPVVLKYGRRRRRGRDGQIREAKGGQP